MTLALRIAAAVLGLLLAAQGTGKLADLGGYRDGLAAFELIPGRVIPAVSLMWAFAEIASGALLVLAALRQIGPGLLSAGVWIAIGIGVAYLLVNGVSWARGLAVGNCTCFGVFLPQRLGLSVIAQDVVVLVWCGWLWVERAGLLPR